MGPARLRVSISTFSFFPLPLRLALPLIREAGLDGAELVAPPRMGERSAARLAALARRHALPILSVHQTLLGPFLSLPRRAAEAVELAVALGAPRVVLHSPHAPHWGDPAAARWLEALVRLQERAQQAGIVISIENVDRNPALDPPVVLGEMDALARFAAAHDLGITLDTCHAMRTGARGPNLLESYRLVRPHLVNVHLSDWRDIGRGERRLIQRSLCASHLLPGHGQAPLRLLLQRLAADGYAGPVTLEVNPWAMRPWSAAQCRRVLGQAVAYIRQAEDAALPPA